jgi:hypothetical protein
MALGTASGFGGGGAWSGFLGKSNPIKLPPNLGTTIGNQLSNPYTQANADALALVNAQYGPQLSLYERQANLIAEQLGFAETDANLSRQMLMSDSGASGARIGLEREGIGLDQRKLDLQEQGIGISERGVGLKDRGLDVRGKGIDIEDRQAAALRAIAGQLFGVNTREAWQTADKANQNIKSDNTVRGSTSTPGYRRALNWVGKDLMNQLDKLTLGDRADTENFTAGNEQRGLGREQIGIEREGLGLEREQLGLDREGVKIAREQLDLKSRNLGISAGELSNKLQQGLQKIGLSQYMNVNELMQGLTSNDLERRALADEMYRTALEYSDMYAYNNPAPSRR